MLVRLWSALLLPTQLALSTIEFGPGWIRQYHTEVVTYHKLVKGDDSVFMGRRLGQDQGDDLWKLSDDVSMKQRLSSQTGFLEGDIVAAPESEGGDPAAYGSVCTGCARWPRVFDYYEVPYMFFENYTVHERAVIAWAMGNIQAHTDIRFVERRDEPDYLVIAEDERQSCSSRVGRVGGAQAMSLNHLWCAKSRASVQHELFHALGLGHEHQRPDRDEFLSIQYDNVCKDHAHNFHLDASLDGRVESPYDVASVMHYGSTAFSCAKGTDGALLKTMEVKDETHNQIIDTTHISPSSCDWQELNSLYPPNTFSTPSPCTPHLVPDTCLASEDCKTQYGDSCVRYCRYNCDAGVSEEMSKRLGYQACLVTFDVPAPGLNTSLPRTTSTVPPTTTSDAIQMSKTAAVVLVGLSLAML